jgi:hypothetical protein
MSFGIREMQFELGPRYERSLNAAVRKVRQKADVQIDITVPQPEHYVLVMKSTSQDFINLQARLRNVVKGPIRRRILKEE